MTKVIKLLVLILSLTFFTLVPAYASSSHSNSNGSWIFLENSEDLYAIKYFTLDDFNKPRLSAVTLYDGNRSLSVNSYTYLCVSPDRNKLINSDNIIEVWNGGDNEGNGAITFKIGNTEIAVDANSGAQLWIKSNNVYNIYAKANWYSGTYSLSVKDYC